MARFLHHSFSCTIRKLPALVLAFSWSLGLGAGGLVFRCAGESIVSLMPMAASGHVSIVGLLICTLLPFLFTAFAVYVSLPQLLAPICFWKAFSFSYLSCAVQAAFGDAGWLIRGLLLFSDTCGVMLLYICCLRHISWQRIGSPAGVFPYAAAAAIAAVLDFGFAGPLLRAAISL